MQYLIASRKQPEAAHDERPKRLKVRRKQNLAVILQPFAYHSHKSARSKVITMHHIYHLHLIFNFRSSPCTVIAISVSVLSYSTLRPAGSLSQALRLIKLSQYVKYMRQPSACAEFLKLPAAMQLHKSNKVENAH